MPNKLLLDETDARKGQSCAAPETPLYRHSWYFAQGCAIGHDGPNKESLRRLQQTTFYIDAEIIKSLFRGRVDAERAR